MDGWSTALEAVRTIGFPAAVAAALAVGLHWWAVRVYRDIGLPVAAEVVRLLADARQQLRRVATATERAADAVDRLCQSYPRHDPRV